MTKLLGIDSGNGQSLKDSDSPVAASAFLCIYPRMMMHIYSCILVNVHVSAAHSAEGSAEDHIAMATSKALPQ